MNKIRDFQLVEEAEKRRAEAERAAQREKRDFELRLAEEQRKVRLERGRTETDQKSASKSISNNGSC